MRRVLLFLVILAATVVQAAPFHFASLGDWGCVPVGGWHKRDELIVARQFSNATAHLGARFILNTGDNFYRCGVHSKTDEVWNSTFEHVFTHDSTMVPWWGCLGNHDYGFPGSAEAEIAYRSPNRDRWNLPARYYHRRFVYPGEVNISLVVLDSAPCQKEYRSSDPKHWDPHCVEGKMPCPGCTFHQNVMQQNCTEQFEWLKRTADTIPKGDWKIMMTHAPATGLTVEDLVGVFQEHNFDLYLNGHIHLLGHYKLDGKGTYITTGAACQVRIREGDIKQHDDDDADEKDKRSACSGKSPWHKCESVFEQTIAGYSTHAFNDDFTELSTFLYDYTGKLLHTTVSKKGDPGRR